MLLIVAQRNDLAARSLAERWRSRGAALLTARDLSMPGWKFDLPAQGPSRLIAEGRPFSSNQIAGVLTRLSAVPATELDHVTAEDRAYVSSEMTAFLLAWLSSLPCPVLNRPTPSGLCGPGWRIEQWIHLAAGLGIPVKSVRRSTSAHCGRSNARRNFRNHCRPGMLGHCRSRARGLFPPSRNRRGRGPVGSPLHQRRSGRQAARRMPLA